MFEIAFLSLTFCVPISRLFPIEPIIGSQTTLQ